MAEEENTQLTSVFAQDASYSKAAFDMDQQTFLGASIRSFSANAGFGDTSSTLNVELIADLGNIGDGTIKGEGQDVYHDGEGDEFSPPPAGSPVFFAMGKRFATTVDVYKHTLDVYYNTSTASDRVKNHFTFGGILQSFVRTKSPDGNPFYSVALTDPREILANVKVVLNNFSSTVMGQSNVLNVFGFLEKNTSKTPADLVSDKRLRRTGQLYNTDELEVTDDDILGADADGASGFNIGTLEEIYGFRFNKLNYTKPSNYGSASFSPRLFTGTGFSRRNERGMPFFRIAQGINALLGHYGQLPNDLQGFGGSIKFRNLHYAIDLSDVPLLPPLRFIDYDSISLLDLIQEICDELNHEMQVVLLPALSEHQGTRLVGNSSGVPVAVIKVITQDRSNPYNLTAIQQFMDYLETQNVPIKSSDLGYEVNNSTTDKFIVGANVVQNHYFKHGGGERLQIDQQATWKPQANLGRTIIPYYGLINNRGVTIPVGDGDFQQILLDSTGLAANGVGKYYVATEMEMRAAIKDYQTWRQFLLFYESVWMEPMADGNILNDFSSSSFYVTVPRCAIPPINKEDGFNSLIAKNPCHPPYGYPLYWGRASAIGIATSSVVNSQSFNARVIDVVGNVVGSEDGRSQVNIDAALENLQKMDVSFLTQEEKEFYQKIKDALKSGNFTFLEEANETSISYLAKSQAMGKAGLQNAQRVYNFVSSIARDCLGKKFLVRIPQNKDQDRRSDFSKPSSYWGGDYTFPSEKLVVNKDPITNDYVFNYTPEPLGGYPPFNNFDDTFKIHISPKDKKCITGSSGRVLCYARFDESQNLDFSGFSKDTFTQEAQNADGIYETDITGFDNTNSDYNSLGNSNPNPYPASDKKSTAFVKCTLDNKLYMPPAFTSGLSKAYYGGYSARSLERRPLQYVDSVSGQTKSYQPSDASVYSPTTESQGTIDSVSYMDLDYLHDSADAEDEANTQFYFNTNYVYALITLPSRVAATKSSAMKNCEEHSLQPLKHIMQSDVVPLFTSPAKGETGSTKKLNYGVEDGAPDDVLSNEHFDKALSKSMSNLSYSFPNKIRVFSPSPVIPDRTAIPLMHKQSYGPWLTNTNDDGDIGGNVEFVKDESLAPWNYAGYSRLGEAGSTLASLGSSYQITSERGSVTFAGGPQGGFQLGQALQGEGGPLITSINVDVSTAGVTTVYKMDLFTASFGKLHKYKQEKIGRISRIAQKIEDERNALERKDLGKNSTNQSYKQLQDEIRNNTIGTIKDLVNAESQVASVPPNKFTLTVTKKDSNTGTNQYSSSVLDGEGMEHGFNKLGNSPENLSRQYYNSVQCSLEDFKSPASLEPHATMSSKEATNIKSRSSFYSDEDDYTLEDITYWRIS
tara:strand:- start:802 stop:4908 length:4107 start_codon:yes stop_codon:yes gene_type:complete